MNPLNIKVKGKSVVLTLGLETLAFAACNGPLVQFNDETNDFKHPVVTNPVAFAEEVVRELMREEEDGTTLVHEMFDKAIERAFENGAEGIVMPGDE